MNETKLDWSDLNLFLAVARGGGLAAGSRATGLSPASLGRHMVALETAVGAVLFQRLPRGYVLTTEGEELLKEAGAVEAHIEAIRDRRAGRDRARPVVISAGTWMCRFLAQNIRRIADDNVRLVLQSGEAVRNIGRREATIGLRNARPMEDAHAVRKTVPINFAPFARPDAADIWIATSAATPSGLWVHQHRSGLIGTEVSNPRTLLDLARERAGQVVLPCFVGDSECDLVRTGPPIRELRHDQWLVVHGEERNTPAVRQTVDKIYKLLRKNRKLFAGEMES